MIDKDRERARRFGAYIKALRVSQGKSQQEVATACGYTTRASISSLENGKNDIAFDKLPALASVLNVEPKELFEVYAVERPESANMAQIEAIRALLNDLNTEQLQQVAAIVKVMRAQNKGGKT